jgi:hypothetical protein
MALLRACRNSRSKPSLGRRGALLFVESGDPPCVGTESYREIFNIDFSALSLNSPTNLRCSNLGTVNQRLRRVGSGLSFETENKAFEKWYNAVVRWIRKNFIRDLAVGHDRDSIGPAAYEWFRAGGLLLPNFRPPLTEAWLAWASVQNQHRTDLAHN